MKQNVSETGSNRRFRKNVKTCLQNKKLLSYATFKGLYIKTGIKEQGTECGERGE